MRFILRMAWRELRASWRRLMFFFICVSVGVGGIVTLRSLIQNVRIALAAEARSLTAADVYLRTDQPWSDEVRGQIEAGVSPIEGVVWTESLRAPSLLTLATKIIGIAARIAEQRMGARGASEMNPVSRIHVVLA